jgi:GNAT superfamily N-acetyltransferase
MTERWDSMDAVSRLDGVCRSAARIAANAFQSDPMWCYIIPDGARRRTALPVVLPLTYAQRYGEVWVTSPVIYGVAAWLSPGNTSITYWRFFHTAALRCAAHLGPAALSRFLRLEVRLEEQHGRDITEPHWYLLLLAVDPPSQGRGVGSQLLIPVLAKAQTVGMPVYLQTLNHGNVAFYERHGFRVISKSVPSGGEPPCWGMVLNSHSKICLREQCGHATMSHNYPIRRKPNVRLSPPFRRARAR